MELEKEALTKSADETAQQVWLLTLHVYLILTFVQLNTTRETVNSLREQGRKNNAIFKRRMETTATEKEEMEAKVKDLEGQIAALTQERDGLQAQSSQDATANSHQDAALRQELEKLRGEKAALEKQLADEKAKPVVPDQSQADLVVSLVFFLSTIVIELAN